MMAQLTSKIDGADLAAQIFYQLSKKFNLFGLISLGASYLIIRQGSNIRNHRVRVRTIRTLLLLLLSQFIFAKTILKSWLRATSAQHFYSVIQGRALPELFFNVGNSSIDIIDQSSS
ncbi:MAG: hypothetical protein HRF40_04685 [Nitrososphaera sp.]|jgi:uncharacterized membrane protein YozB (DUF420 family)